MLHPVKIGDNIYSVEGGKVLINGKVEDIKSGKVLINGKVEDIKFGTPISDFTEGTLVYMNESGSPVQFYVAKHDYESELNGTGRTLFVRKAVDIKYYPWDLGTDAHKGYENCTMDTWFTGTYLSMLDADIQTLIGTTKIPCCRGTKFEFYTLERSVFTLSHTEYTGGGSTGTTGLGSATVAVEGTKLPIASTLLEDTEYLSVWTRSLDMENPGYNAWYVQGNTRKMCVFSAHNQYRPAFTLPSDTLVDDDYNIIT